MGSNKKQDWDWNTFCNSRVNNKHKDVGYRCIPVMVVTHSRSRALISVRSQAPASVGVGRGRILGKDSAVSGFEVDVEGRTSAWKVNNY